ncbi:MAG: LysR substrate-binding domain-containing protein [Deltaproteobacteria bacterium]
MDPRFTLDQLIVLDTITRAGTFSGAAKELHRVTSAVSYGVKALEEALGIALFERAGRRAALTPAGRLVLDGARDVLERARAVSRLGDDLADGWEPCLDVVLDGILPLPPIMAAVRRFGERGVPTQVRLVVEYLSGVRRRWERDGADLMLALDHEGGRRYVARPLPPVEMVLVAHVSHPLHARPKPRDRKVLAEYVEISVADSGTTAADRTRRLFVGSPQVVELSDFHAKREALQSGVGYGWLPLHLAKDAMRRGELKTVGFSEGDRYTFEPRLVHRRDVPLGRAARLFVSLYEEEVSRRPRKRTRT